MTPFGAPGTLPVPTLGALFRSAKAAQAHKIPLEIHNGRVAANNDYMSVNILGRGTFSTVHLVERASDRRIFACKRFNQPFTFSQLVNVRELRAHSQIPAHPNILGPSGVLYDEPTQTLSILFPVMPMTLADWIGKQASPLTETHMKKLVHQLFSALSHLHRQDIIHRDIKPENIFLDSDRLYLGDLGSTASINSTPLNPTGNLTEYIITRWYRPPECLLFAGGYDDRVDTWGVGCILYLMATRRHLFPGRSEINQLVHIHRILGTPSEATLASMARRRPLRMTFTPMAGTGWDASQFRGFSTDLLDFLVELLAYDPAQRPSCTASLAHAWLRDTPPPTQPVKTAHLAVEWGAYRDHASNFEAGGAFVAMATTSAAVAVPQASSTLQAASTNGAYKPSPVPLTTTHSGPSSRRSSYSYTHPPTNVSPRSTTTAASSSMSSEREAKGMPKLRSESHAPHRLSTTSSMTTQHTAMHEMTKRHTATTTRRGSVSSTGAPKVHGAAGTAATTGNATMASTTAARPLSSAPMHSYSHHQTAASMHSTRARATATTAASGDYVRARHSTSDARSVASGTSGMSTGTRAPVGKILPSQVGSRLPSTVTRTFALASSTSAHRMGAGSALPDTPPLNERMIPMCN